MKEVIAALLIALLAFEINAWYPKLLSQLVNIAIRRLPPGQRERYREEWSAHLSETPGAIVKLWQALGFVWASGNMFPRWRRGIAQIRSIRRADAAERLTHRALELIIVVGGLIALAPLLLIVSAVLKIRGPVFHRQRYNGADGSSFDELRFFTGNDQTGSSRWYQRFDHFLRTTAINDLPLLLNVIRSEIALMSRPREDINSKGSKPSLVNVRAVTTINGRRQHRSIMITIARTVKLYIATLISQMVSSLFLKYD